MKVEEKNHSTESELSFLKTLSLSGFIKRKQLYKPRPVIEKYLNASKGRSDWGKMNKDAILSYAEVLLKTMP